MAIKHSASLNFRLAAELKAVIEDAAATTGQSISNFAISTLVKGSLNVLEQAQVTELSNRDRDRFIAILDADDSRPNAALRNAARKQLATCTSEIKKKGQRGLRR
jgi:uncharacterized protein (DUF1778 family)